MDVLRGLSSLAEKYTFKINNSSEPVKKAIFMFSVVGIISILLLGWVLTMKISSGGNNGALRQEQIRELDADAHSILDLFKKRLESNNEQFISPPAYFLDTENIPSLNRDQINH